jgi:hypothetical protein
VTGTIGGGVLNGDLLIAFAEAVLGEHDSALTGRATLWRRYWALLTPLL